MVLGIQSGMTQPITATAIQIGRSHQPEIPISCTRWIRRKTEQTTPGIQIRDQPRYRPFASVSGP